MCEQMDIHDLSAASDFNAATFDFLYPVHVNKLMCHMGLCKQCSPQLFSCRYTENLINVTGMSDDDITKARTKCSSRNTCDTEPVGGEGGLVETPIRDDALSQNIFHRNNGLLHRMRWLKITRNVIIILIIMFITYHRGP